MTIVVVQHDAADYDAWRPVFDEHRAARQAHGCTSERVYRAADDPNSITIVTEWPSKEAAEGFMADPSLAEAMARGGVLGPPTVTIGERAPLPAP
ncbi:MAG: antibiotic biosynthesis monooxygenase [Actinobacteria bacterium]|nr:antibiotic biosynthesis monooxygenase [Actinomycetota bacterium]